MWWRHNTKLIWILIYQYFKLSLIKSPFYTSGLSVWSSSECWKIKIYTKKQNMHVGDRFINWWKAQSKTDFTTKLYRKTLDTIGNHTKLCAFGFLISRPQVLNLKRGNLFFFFSKTTFSSVRGSRFSQCFILSTMKQRRAIDSIKHCEKRLPLK